MKFAIKGVLAALAVLDRAIGVIERLIIGGTMLAMALLMSAHVVGQLLFDRGIPGTYEVTEMLIVVMTFVGVSYAARHARHIRMSALYEQLHGGARKALLMLICVGTAKPSRLDSPTLCRFHVCGMPSVPASPVQDIVVL